jgi:hypothetical protein
LRLLAAAAPATPQLRCLQSLRLRLPYLPRRSLWLELAALPGLTALRVDVARCLPGCRFHLRDALAPLGCLPALRELSLGGFHSLCDRCGAAGARGQRAVRALRRRGAQGLCCKRH